MCAGASLCPNGAYLAINPTVIGGSEARMCHVVAHEICHALDVEARRPVNEAEADSCAAAHGFPGIESVGPSSVSHGDGALANLR